LRTTEQATEVRG